MRRNMGYGLLCGALACLLALVAVGAAIAQECSIWYDTRLCGQGSVEYEGPVLYDYEVFSSPISIADSPGHYSLAYLNVTHERARFYMHGKLISDGSYNPDMGCYTDWNAVDNPGATSFMCWDGEDTVNIWYGTLQWSGFGYDLGGAWIYRMSLVQLTEETRKEMRRYIARRAGPTRRLQPRGESQGEGPGQGEKP